MESSYEQHLQIKTDRCNRLREDLQTLFPDPICINLEIGCGHGHYLAAYAQQHPEEFCMGVDLVTKRIEKGIVKKEKRHLENIHFQKADIKEWMSCLPDRVRFNRVFILFPDPWPKNRHAKNRIIQTELLNLIAKRSNEQTRLHFRTDHDGQFAWGMDKIGENFFWEIDDSEPWPFENSSFFQDMMDNFYSLTAILRSEQPKDNAELEAVETTNESPTQ